MSEQPSSPPGRQLFVDWLGEDPNHRYPAMVAKAIGVSAAAVSGWVSGKVVPDRLYRPALRVLTGIPEDAWETERERERERTALLGAAKAVEQLPPPPPKSAPNVDGDAESAEPAA